MLAIEEYATLKLAIAEPVRSLLELARRTRDENAEAAARDLLARLAEDRFNLAVVGLYNRGKSSLINALLGTDRLPTGIVPLTSVITTVGYGDRERLLLHLRGSGVTREVSLDRLAEFVTERANPGNRLDLEHAEIRLPAELLRLGFFFVDTPGVGSPIAANTRTTRAYLPRLDAAIFVTSVEVPLGEADIELYRQVASLTPAVFTVVNKADLVGPLEHAEALAFIRERLASASPAEVPPPLVLSARTGAGIPELRAALAEFLRDEKPRTLLVGVVRRALAIAHRLEGRFSYRDATGDTDALARQADVERETARLRTERAAVIDDLRATIADALTTRLRPDAEAGCARIAGEHALPGAHLDAYRAALETALRELLQDAANRLEALIDAADRVMLPDGDTVAGHELATGNALLDEVAAARPIVPPFAISAPAAPRWGTLPLLGGRARRRLEVAWQHERTRCRDALLDAALSAGRDWVGRLDWLSDRRFEAAVAAARAAATEALPREADVELREARERLTALRAQLDRVPESGQDAITDTTLAAPTTPLGRCPFCARVREEVFDLLAREQYDLDLSSAARTELVANPFCDLHTWLFQSLASPHGVCVILAPRITRIARRLETWGREDAAEPIDESIRALRPSRATCPACRVAARAEAAVLHDVDRIRSLICMPHLQQVTEQLQDRDTLRRILTRQSSILSRLATEMQSYVLKFDAVRRELLTESEAVAHLRAVAALAGEQWVRTATPGSDGRL
jgi:GTP-binding protein EngB required for normal cell division